MTISDNGQIPTKTLQGQMYSTSISKTEMAMRKIRCLARAYGDKPLDRLALGKEDRLIYVSNPSLIAPEQVLALRAVGFPRTCVFRFDPKLFERLLAAYESKDSGRLASLWNEAKPLHQELPEIEAVIHAKPPRQP